MRARWLLLPVVALVLGGCGSPSADSGLSMAAAEAEYLSEMRAAGQSDDEANREFARAMCQASTVQQAKATMLVVLDNAPKSGHVFGLAAGWGIRAYCPDKADLWLEAGKELAEEIQ